MRRVRLDRLAELEIRDGVEWYERQEAGLGIRFWRAVDDAIMRFREDQIVASTPVPEMPRTFR